MVWSSGLRYIISGGGALITGRTSMGTFSGAPPGPGAADAFAAIAWARSGVSTSTIQNPARNSLDSGNTPSVMERPSLPACTNLAWSGINKPSVRRKPLYTARVAVALAVGGRNGDALRIAHELETISRKRYVSPYGLAQSTQRQIRKRTHSNGRKLPMKITLFGWDTSPST